ncbi:5-methyltetrahydrofolate--homocysteine methyltransferase, partial [uncultured Microcoleus sp.]
SASTSTWMKANNFIPNNQQPQLSPITQQPNTSPL